jgi:hypothetical protein
MTGSVDGDADRRGSCCLTSRGYDRVTANLITVSVGTDDHGLFQISTCREIWERVGKCSWPPVLLRGHAIYLVKRTALNRRLTDSFVSVLGQEVFFFPMPPHVLLGLCGSPPPAVAVV